MAAKKVLYVDDEEMNLELFKMSFLADFEIVTTQFPEKASQIMRDQDIEILITDYKMPKMNGMDLIKEIKGSNPRCKCMILSGYLENDLLLDKSIIYKYILKPYDRNEVRKHVESAMVELGI